MMKKRFLALLPLLAITLFSQNLSAQGKCNSTDDPLAADQCNETDIYAIPLDSSEYEDNEEIEQLEETEQALHREQEQHGPKLD